MPHLIIAALGAGLILALVFIAARRRAVQRLARAIAARQPVPAGDRPGADWPGLCAAVNAMMAEVAQLQQIRSSQITQLDATLGSLQEAVLMVDAGNRILLANPALQTIFPRAREIIYNFMRLRALRVEVDVKLATGEFAIPEAAKYLETTVPMDAHTALGEAASFAAGPGQAITYEIGKLQILAFLTDARLRQGDRFSLRAFHDFLWKNGNVPIALQRWEMLGLDDEIRALGDATGR